MAFRPKNDVSEYLSSQLQETAEACPRGNRRRWTGPTDAAGCPVYRLRLRGGPTAPAMKQYYEQSRGAPVEEGHQVIADCGDDRCFAHLREIDEREQMSRFAARKAEAYRLLDAGVDLATITRKTGVPRIHLEYVLEQRRAERAKPAPVPDAVRELMERHGLDRERAEEKLDLERRAREHARGRGELS